MNVSALIFLVIALIVFPIRGLMAQTQAIKSDVDAELSTRAWGLLPLVDNIKDIYAKPLTLHLRDLLMQHKPINFREIQALNEPQSPESLEQNDSTVRSLLKQNDVDGLWAGRISQGPQGLAIRLLLFQGSRGQLFLTESVEPKPISSIDEAKLELTQLFKTIISRLPYQGLVLSRNQQVVTINLGSSSGIQVGDSLSVVFFLEQKRHPIHKFLTHSEIEIIGKLRVTQVEDQISFAQVTFEKVPNAVNRDSKIFAKPGVTYSDPGVFNLTTSIDTDSPASRENLARNGQTKILIGFGDYSHTQSVTSGEQPSAKKPLSPTVTGGVELWISREWLASIDLAQTVAKLSNPITGSRPSELDAQTQLFRLMGGYRILTTERFDGPQIVLSLGWTQSQSKVTDSTPRAFTSETYSGLTFGLSGKTPLNGTLEKSLWSMGAELFFVYSPARGESPVTSAANSESSLAQFGLFADYELDPKTTLRTGLEFYQSNSTLSGTGTRSPAATSSSVARNSLYAGAIFKF